MCIVYLSCFFDLQAANTNDTAEVGRFRGPVECEGTMARGNEGALVSAKEGIPARVLLDMYAHRLIMYDFMVGKQLSELPYEQRLGAGGRLDTFYPDVAGYQSQVKQFKLLSLDEEEVSEYGGSDMEELSNERHVSPPLVPLQTRSCASQLPSPLSLTLSLSESSNVSESSDDATPTFGCSLKDYERLGLEDRATVLGLGAPKNRKIFFTSTPNTREALRRATPNTRERFFVWHQQKKQVEGISPRAGAVSPAKCTTPVALIKSKSQGIKVQ